MKKIYIVLIMVFICGVLAFTIPKKTYASEIVDIPSVDTNTSNLIGKHSYILPFAENLIGIEFSYPYNEYYTFILEEISFDYSVLQEENDNPLSSQYFYQITNVNLFFVLYQNSTGDISNSFVVECIPNGTNYFYDSYINNSMLNGTSVSPPSSYEKMTLFDVDIEINLELDTYIQCSSIVKIRTNNNQEILQLVGDYYIDVDYEFNYIDYYFNYHFNNIALNVASLYYFRDFTFDYLDNHDLNNATFEFTDWITNATNGFFDNDIIGTLSLGEILLFIVSIGLLIFVLRFFAGG